MALLDGTVGGLLIGVILGALLYGVSLSQIYYYYTRYPRDPPYMKTLVAAVWATDTIHQGLISHSIYWYLVTNYGDWEALSRLTDSIIIEVVFQGFTGIFVQSFFAVRIYKLSGQKLYLVIPVVILIIAEFSVSIAYSVKALSLQTFAELTRIKTLSLLINVFAAAGDVTIAVILCTILHISKTGSERSNHILNRLMIFSVNTGLLTSICACMSLITILALPDTFVYITFFFLIGRLYSNSLMATLNARKGLREGRSLQDTSISLRDIHPHAAAGNAADSGRHDLDPSIAIRVDTHKESKHDRDHETDYESSKYASSERRMLVENA